MSDGERKACGSGCGCGPARRDFLKWSAMAGAAAALGGFGAMAGPFTAEDFEKLVPADKKLRPEWVKSLYDRGAPTIYRGKDLDLIGMPIGGIGAGQVYLGGDGRLWHWDIFNQHIGTGDGHYARPLRPSSPIEQGFALRIQREDGGEVRSLDRNGFSQITFRGEYPMGFVEYRDPHCPLQVNLEAFSPFIPLNTADSAMPAIAMRYVLKNTSNEVVRAEIGGWLENAACRNSSKLLDGIVQNVVRRVENVMLLSCWAEEAPATQPPAARPDITFEDFEKGTYDGWTKTGTAFGDGPIEKAKMPAYQGDVGSQGKFLVNTHNTRNGEDVGRGDAHTGTLTSKPFRIERNFISFLIGGGGHRGRTCMNLLIDGRVVDSATGRNDNRMGPSLFDVRRFAGQTAQLQIVDNEAGSWGNIGIDQIVFTDLRPAGAMAMKDAPDYGSMALALLDAQETDFGMAALPEEDAASRLFATVAPEMHPGATAPLGEKLVGAVGRKLTLKPGDEAVVTFIIGWHFRNLKIAGLRPHAGRRYGLYFTNAAEVVLNIAGRLMSLRAGTRLWHDTWYDSTLPYWFLDRTFANTSILATSTCYWLGNGRFYGWEGVGCCPGTCGHVWQYAHAVARLFPELERSTREVELDIAMQADGAIHFRAEHNNFPAADAQAGEVLRCYREHQMSRDEEFLRRIWPGARKALQYLIDQDGNGDGILEGKQHNTLDTDWYGPVGWLSSLYLAALAAGEAMATEMGDAAFAKKAAEILDRGKKRLIELCWNGEYFVHRPDPKHPDAMKSGNGCEIDQVMGQSWAFQVGLGRVIDEEHTSKALESLWRYNFTPDVGPYRNVFKLGRWYAMPGEAGLLMCTWPKGDRADAQGKAPDWAFGYFNECMNGFEYQVAGHMVWEGMVEKGLAITRAVHDRYHASKRNPWNEVECGDHYARSMASYGVYLAACGYEYHGPKGYLAFAPRLTPEDFRCAFTAAEGWGTFSQKREGRQQTNTIHIKHGTLLLDEFAIEAPADFVPVVADLNGNALKIVSVRREGSRSRISFQRLRLNEGSVLTVRMGI